jgi:hypothetical protein
MPKEKQVFESCKLQVVDAVDVVQVVQVVQVV